MSESIATCILNKFWAPARQEGPRAFASVGGCRYKRAAGGGESCVNRWGGQGIGQAGPLHVRLSSVVRFTGLLPPLGYE